MRIVVIRAFAFAEDGINGRLLAAGAEVEVAERFVPGLEREGYVRRATSASPPAPSAEPKEDPASVEIPEDWRDLKWNELAALAAKVSDAKIVNKVSAIAAIEAELERREAAAKAEAEALAAAQASPQA